jgi:hypothetical protein
MEAKTSREVAALSWSHSRSTVAVTSLAWLGGTDSTLRVLPTLVGGTQDQQPGRLVALSKRAEMWVTAAASRQVLHALLALRVDHVAALPAARAPDRDVGRLLPPLVDHGQGRIGGVRASSALVDEPGVRELVQVALRQVTRKRAGTA